MGKCHSVILEAVSENIGSGDIPQGNLRVYEADNVEQVEDDRIKPRRPVDDRYVYRGTDTSAHSGRTRNGRNVVAAGALSFSSDALGTSRVVDQAPRTHRQHQGPSRLFDNVRSNYNRPTRINYYTEYAPSSQYRTKPDTPRPFKKADKQRSPVWRPSPFRSPSPNYNDYYKQPSKWGSNSVALNNNVRKSQTYIIEPRPTLHSSTSPELNADVRHAKTTADNKAEYQRDNTEAFIKFVVGSPRPKKSGIPLLQARKEESTLTTLNGLGIDALDSTEPHQYAKRINPLIPSRNELKPESVPDSKKPVGFFIPFGDVVDTKAVEENKFKLGQETGLNELFSVPKASQKTSATTNKPKSAIRRPLEQGKPLAFFDTAVELNRKERIRKYGTVDYKGQLEQVNKVEHKRISEAIPKVDSKWTVNRPSENKANTNIEARQVDIRRVDNDRRLAKPAPFLYDDTGGFDIALKREEGAPSAYAESLRSGVSRMQNDDDVPETYLIDDIAGIFGDGGVMLFDAFSTDLLKEADARMQRRERTREGSSENTEFGTVSFFERVRKENLHWRERIATVAPQIDSWNIRKPSTGKHHESGSLGENIPENSRPGVAAWHEHATQMKQKLQGAATRLNTWQRKSVMELCRARSVGSKKVSH